ncbi:hypothetical protein AGR6A_pTi0028 [Agrobacterium sp. NCPPB 925]|nr:hypothetical protein AGR6A_pTi0028 [Agrobacterium sp. NCPPB 925]
MEGKYNPCEYHAQISDFDTYTPLKFSGNNNKGGEHDISHWEIEPFRANRNFSVDSCTSVCRRGSHATRRCCRRKRRHA